MRDALPGIEALRPADGPLLVAVGVFDGLHRGHLYLLRELRRAARRLAARPAVLTFDHHPDEILAGAAPPLLCDPDERLARLERAGVAVTVVEHFDDALRRTAYDAFVASIRARTELAGFLMTPDAAFGHERRGTPETLARLGREVGFEVVVVPPFDLAGRPVRSTAIRSAITAGDLAAARVLLGRRVAVTGVVAGRHGAGRDVTVGFPLPVALPPPGTYAATVAAAWAPSLRPGPARRATVTVEPAGTLAVRAHPEALRHDRLRVAFAGTEPRRPAGAGSMGERARPDRPEELFAGHPLALAVLERVRAALASYEPITVRTTRSQVALRRRGGFAYLWPPGRYLARPAAEVVLSIALGRQEPSPRFKEVVHPAPAHWMHHLEIRSLDEVDDEVIAWLREAAERAG